MVKKEILQIIKNDEVADNWFIMEIAMQDVTHPAPLPGQFISIAFSDISFRRPFAIQDYKKGESFSILYQIRPHYISLLNPQSLLYQKENASTRMKYLRKGDSIDCMYYHGNSFSYQQAFHPILVAGGIGLGPMLYFSQWLHEYHHITPTLIVGARTARFIPQVLLTQYCATQIITTDDGTLGIHAHSIFALEQKLAEYTDKKVCVYLCGPLEMMRAGARLCEQMECDAWVSLDSVMACAMGACVGCVVPVIPEKNLLADYTVFTNCKKANCKKANYKKVSWKKACIQGPIFNTTHIIWEELHDH